LPSVVPVLKEKLAAHTGIASHTPMVNVAAIKLTRILTGRVITFVFIVVSSVIRHHIAY
jgi:hypothetical protein